jgi:hypothetical protein
MMHVSLLLRVLNSEAAVELASLAEIYDILLGSQPFYV